MNRKAEGNLIILNVGSQRRLRAGLNIVVKRVDIQTGIGAGLLDLGSNIRKFRSVRQTVINYLISFLNLGKKILGFDNVVNFGSQLAF